MFIRIIFPILLVLSLSACGGGGSSGKVALNPQTPNETPKNPPTEQAPDRKPVPDKDAKTVVVFEWDRPDGRENGEFLEIDDIGGYEIRYRSSKQDDYAVVKIDDGLAEVYRFTDLTGAIEFEIATYDTDGLYSVFVPLTGRKEVL